VRKIIFKEDIETVHLSGTWNSDDYVAIKGSQLFLVSYTDLSNTKYWGFSTVEDRLSHKYNNELLYMARTATDSVRKALDDNVDVFCSDDLDEVLV